MSYFPCVLPFKGLLVTPADMPQKAGLASPGPPLQAAAPFGISLFDEALRAKPESSRTALMSGDRFIV